MIQLNKKTKTLIVIGTGGVGKTTLAAAIAVGEAYQGKKVLVITIDPSLRLAQALDFKPNGELQEIKLPENKGQLFATTIDHEKVFLHFLKRGVQKQQDQKSNSASIEKIAQNKLFQKLSQQLSTSQDFTTLYTLYQFVESQEYDFIVLDTPPAQHTWSFLKAPEKLRALFSEEISSFFRTIDSDSKSFFKKIISSGTDQALNILQKLTGSDFITELRSFFNLIHVWQSALIQVINDCQRILISKNTEYLLVTQFDANRFLAAEDISRKVYNEGFNLTHFIINRVPDWLEEKSKSPQEEVEKFRNHYLSTMTRIKTSLKASHQNLKVYKSFNLSQNIKNEEFQKIYQNISRLD